MLDQIARLGDVCLGPLPLPLLSSLAALGETGSTTTTEATATVGNLKQRRHLISGCMLSGRAGGRAIAADRALTRELKSDGRARTEGGGGASLNMNDYSGT